MGLKIKQNNILIWFLQSFDGGNERSGKPQLVPGTRNKPL